MSKIEQNREKKKQAILVAAKSEFLSQGYTCANMDVIAQQAKMTKQTLYRYFPSKLELFQATLMSIGKTYNERYSQHLEIEDTREALIAFAVDFMQFHFSPEHIATQRLLISEVTQAPEIVESFMKNGPHHTQAALSAFFTERLGLEAPESKVNLWIGMLLSSRNMVLLGVAEVTHEQIQQTAIEATDIILAAMNP